MPPTKKILVIFVIFVNFVIFVMIFPWDERKKKGLQVYLKAYRKRRRPPTLPQPQYHRP